MMLHPSLTTEGIEHDDANMLTEFIWLNRDVRCNGFPWVGDNSKEWGRLVAAIKKLMGSPYNLLPQQLAFYIWQCKPHRIHPAEFAKMVAVARRLFKSYELEQVSRFYIERRKELARSVLEKTKYKENKPKTLLTFLRELERGEE